MNNTNGSNSFLKNVRALVVNCTLALLLTFISWWVVLQVSELGNLGLEPYEDYIWLGFSIFYALSVVLIFDSTTERSS